MEIGAIGAGGWQQEPRYGARNRPAPNNSAQTAQSHVGESALPNAEKPSTVEPTTNAGKTDGQTLSQKEQKEVQKLKQRDQEVKAHEQAHKAAGGQYAGSASFEYTRGPDGKRYAVGGEVQIDVSEIAGDPAATKAKMQQVQRAALAPAQPSSQDRSVAAKASKKAARATQELMEQRAEELAKTTEKATDETDKTGEITEAPAAGRPGKLPPAYQAASPPRPYSTPAPGSTIQATA